MKTITCPNCGSGSVQQLTEEKYFCNGCEQIFMLHNLSKEFQQTDEHISAMHSDLKREIGQMAKSSANSEYNSLVESAEYYMRAGYYQKAYESFTEITEKYPQYSAGWYGCYRALTKEFTEFERDDIVYGYVEENGEWQGFAGWIDVRNALQCDDADREKITTEVTQYVRKCAEQRKQAMEYILRSNVEEYAAVKRRQAELCSKSWKTLFGIQANSTEKKVALKQAVSEILGEEYRHPGEVDSEYEHYILFRDMNRWYMLCIFFIDPCVLMDVCNQLLSQTENPDSFIRMYTTDPFSAFLLWQNEPEYPLMEHYRLFIDQEGCLCWHIELLQNESLQIQEEWGAGAENFAENLMAGQIERFRYLLDGIPVVSPAGIGTSMEAAAQGMDSGPAQRFCPNCGASLDADAVFCGNCGTRIG